MRAKFNGACVPLCVVGALCAVLSNTAWLVFMEMALALMNAAIFVGVNAEPRHDR